MSFRDHRGPGGVFRMMPARAVSAEQLGLSREIQALCDRAGRSRARRRPALERQATLISAFVDLINRTRRDHVITIESEINFVHERSGSFISQREVRGGTRRACWRRPARRCARIPTCSCSRSCGSPGLDQRWRSKRRRPASSSSAASRRTTPPTRSIASSISMPPEDAPAGAAGARAEPPRRASRRCCCGRSAAAAWRRAKCC